MPTIPQEITESTQQLVDSSTIVDKFAHGAATIYIPVRGGTLRPLLYWQGYFQDKVTELAGPYVQQASDAATTAQGAASTATTKAGEASDSATAAAGSASTAQDSATTATTQASAASDSATAAAGSASTAQGAATTATTQAGAASDSATAAADSASTAQGAATTATTKAGEASDSATAAAGSASTAQDAATTATTQASEASSSATAAAGSASTAQGAATTATTRASEASSSATAAAGSAQTATDQADRAEGFANGLNLPSATGNGGRLLRQKVDESGFEYIDQPLTNFLYNSNFLINQRGKDAVPGPWGWARDRWGMRGVSNTGGSTTLGNVTVWNGGWPSASYLMVNMAGHTSPGYLFQRLPNASRFESRRMTFGMIITPDVDLYVYLKASIGYEDGTPNTTTPDTGYVKIPAQTQTLFQVALDVPEVDVNGKESSYLELNLKLSGSADGAAPCGDGSYRFGAAQLVFGDVLPPYEDPDPAIELTRCQYFFCQEDQNNIIWSGQVTAGYKYYNPYRFPVEMRTIPAVTLTEYASGGPFSSSPGLVSQLNTRGFYEGREATSSATSTYFRSIFTADAEI